MEIDIGFSRGYPVYCLNGVTYYQDGTVFDDSRPCVHCGRELEIDGPDPCIGYLSDPAVVGVCCGHGVPGEEYVLTTSRRYSSIKEYLDAIINSRS